MGLRIPMTLLPTSKRMQGCLSEVVMETMLNMLAGLLDEWCSLLLLNRSSTRRVYIELWGTASG